MKLFIDTANLEDIETTLRRGFVRGITTNPSLLAKEPKAAFEGHIKKIIALIIKYQPGIHLSVEVFSRDQEEILAQANRFREEFRYEHLSIKIQIGWDELEVIRKLSEERFSVNCTCCMTINQVVMAAAAGARYVSLFVGRIRDGGITEKGFEKERGEGIERGVFAQEDFDPLYVLRSTRQLFDQEYPDVEIIAGSMRSAGDVKESLLSGAHIVTVPPKLFLDMISHFKTEEVIGQFLADFQDWLQ